MGMEGEKGCFGMGMGRGGQTKRSHSAFRLCVCILGHENCDKGHSSTKKCLKWLM